MPVKCARDRYLMAETPTWGLGEAMGRIEPDPARAGSVLTNVLVLVIGLPGCTISLAHQKTPYNPP